MADLSKSAINKKYDQLRADLKSGELSQEQFKRKADRLYKLYHSKANKAQRAKDAAPAPKKPAAEKPKKAPRGYTPGKLYGEDVKPKKAPRGYTPGKVYGEDVKPNKSKAAQQPKAAKPKTRRSPGGRAQVKRSRDTAKKVRKTIGKVGKSLGKLSDAFKLTRKAGEVFTVGNMKYVSDGKGGIRSSQRIR